VLYILVERTHILRFRSVKDMPSKNADTPD